MAAPRTPLCSSTWLICLKYLVFCASVVCVFGSLPRSPTVPLESPAALSSQCDSYLDSDANSSSLKHIHQLIFQISQRSKLVSSLCTALLRKLTHVHHRSRTFAFQAYFSSDLFFLLKREALWCPSNLIMAGAQHRQRLISFGFAVAGRKWEGHNPWGAKSKWLRPVTRGTLWKAQRRGPHSIVEAYCTLSLRWLVKLSHRWWWCEAESDEHTQTDHLHPAVHNRPLQPGFTHRTSNSKGSVINRVIPTMDLMCNVRGIVCTDKPAEDYLSARHWVVLV